LSRRGSELDQASRGEFEGELAIVHAALVGSLAAGIAHDLNNPLAAILGFAQAIRMDVDRGEAMTPEALHCDLQTIEHQAMRASGLVRDLLELARPLPSDPEATPARLEPLVRQSMRLVDYAAQRVCSALELALGEGGDEIAAIADAGHMRHLLVELMVEAIRATRRGVVRITIESRETEQLAVVRMSASGEPPQPQLSADAGLARELAARMGGAVQERRDRPGALELTLTLPLAS
jgi:signal transduction histidine kinase